MANPTPDEIGGSTKFSAIGIDSNGNIDIGELRGLFSIHGFKTFDTATLKLQGSLDDGTTFTDITGLSFTAPFTTNFQYRGKVRINISGAGTEDIDFYLKQIDRPVFQ